MITIYGKANCGFCTKAKTFAESQNIRYEYKDVGRAQDLLTELMNRAPVAVKSVPQIFIGKEYIGGYKELLQYVEDTGYTGSGSTL